MVSSEPFRPVNNRMYRICVSSDNFSNYSDFSALHCIALLRVFVPSDLHTHRFKNNAPSDILFLERFLEDELTSQLMALKADMPDPYLFRKDMDIPFTGMFGSQTETTPIPTAVPVATSEIEIETEGGFGAYKNLLGEGVLESLVICIVLGLLMMAPQQQAVYDAYPY
jgi:hypothetical protein